MLVNRAELPSEFYNICEFVTLTEIRLPLGLFAFTSIRRCYHVDTYIQFTFFAVQISHETSRQPLLPDITPLMIFEALRRRFSVKSIQIVQMYVQNILPFIKMRRSSWRL